MAISRQTMALSALIASVWGGAGSCAVAQNAAPEQAVVPATGPARARAHGQSLPVSNPREILATDPAAFIQLLDDFRPSPVTSETKQMVLKSLPRELKGRAVNARDRAKLEVLYRVLRAVQRDGVYEIRVIENPPATIAIDGRAVLLISEGALGVLDADQLGAAVAHEAAHEYVWEEWQRSDKRDDWKRLRQLELVCDGIALVILQQLGLKTSSLIQGFEKLTYLNLLWFGPPPTPSRYPTLAERREFAREVAAWMTGQSRKEHQVAPACSETAELPVRRAISMSALSSLSRLPPPSRSSHGRQPDGTPQHRGARPRSGRGRPRTGGDGFPVRRENRDGHPRWRGRGHGEAPARRGHVVLMAHELQDVTQLTQFETNCERTIVLHANKSAVFWNFGGAARI